MASGKAEWRPLANAGRLWPQSHKGFDSSGYLTSQATDAKYMKCFGGPEGIRTLDLFHAMEARSQLRHRPISYRWDSFDITMV